MSRRKSDDDMIWLLLLVAQYMLDGCYAQQAPVQVVRTVPVPPRDEAERLIDKGAATLKKARKAAAPLRDALYGKPAAARPLTRGEELPGSQLTRQAVLSIAQHVKFADPKLASAIAFAESGGVPGVVKRSSKEVSVGLWQINTMVHPYSVADMRDPIKNARAAFEISKGGRDWSPWTMYTNGKYKQFQTGLFA